MLVKTNITLKLGRGKEVHHTPPGTEINLPKEEAEELIERGFVALVSAENEAIITASTPSIDDITDAIFELDEERDFTPEGPPKIEALERVLNASITEKQRDAAWDKVKVDEPQEDAE